MAKKARPANAVPILENPKLDRVGQCAIHIVNLMAKLFDQADFFMERGLEFCRKDTSVVSSVANRTREALVALAELLTEAIPIEQERRKQQPDYWTGRGTQLVFRLRGGSEAQYQPGDRAPVSVRSYLSGQLPTVREELREEEELSATVWLNSARGAVFTYAADFWSEFGRYPPLTQGEGFRGYALDLGRGEKLVVHGYELNNGDCWYYWGKQIVDFPRLDNGMAVKEWIRHEAPELTGSGDSGLGRGPGQNGLANRPGPSISSICRQEQALHRISDALATIQNACKNRAQAGMLDLHRSIQRFFCRFLNEAYGLNLVELDNSQPNFPAIDLGDKDAQRCFQITSNNSGAKVQATLDTYVEKRLNEQYGRDHDPGNRRPPTDIQEAPCPGRYPIRFREEHSWNTGAYQSRQDTRDAGVGATGRGHWSGTSHCRAGGDNRVGVGSPGTRSPMCRRQADRETEDAPSRGRRPRDAVPGVAKQ